MPDFDSGHLFLTTLAPIRDSAKDASMHTSFTQAARIALAKLPTALQSPATLKTGVNSPFSRNRRTHLARMFVLNDVVYNGRTGRNALATAITRDDPTVFQPVDRLNTSYLVFCADIDAVEEDGAPLPRNLSPDRQRRVRDAYARELWRTMEAELRDVPAGVAPPRWEVAVLRQLRPPAGHEAAQRVKLRRPRRQYIAIGRNRNRFLTGHGFNRDVT